MGILKVLLFAFFLPVTFILGVGISALVVAGVFYKLIDWSGEKILATLHLPLDMGKLGDLLLAFGRVFPGSKVRPGASSLEMEIFLPEVE